MSDKDRCGCVLGEGAPDEADETLAVVRGYRRSEEQQPPREGDDCDDGDKIADGGRDDLSGLKADLVRRREEGEVKIAAAAVRAAAEMSDKEKRRSVCEKLSNKGPKTFSAVRRYRKSEEQHTRPHDDDHGIAGGGSDDVWDLKTDMIRRLEQREVENAVAAVRAGVENDSVTGLEGFGEAAVDDGSDGGTERLGDDFESRSVPAGHRGKEPDLVPPPPAAHRSVSAPPPTYQSIFGSDGSGDGAAVCPTRPSRSRGSIDTGVSSRSLGSRFQPPARRASARTLRASRPGAVAVRGPAVRMATAAPPPPSLRRQMADVSAESEMVPAATPSRPQFETMVTATLVVDEDDESDSEGGVSDGLFLNSTARMRRGFSEVTASTSDGEVGGIGGSGQVSAVAVPAEAVVRIPSDSELGSKDDERSGLGGFGSGMLHGKWRRWACGAGAAMIVLMGVAATAGLLAGRSINASESVGAVAPSSQSPLRPGEEGNSLPEPTRSPTARLEDGDNSNGVERDSEGEATGKDGAVQESARLVALRDVLLPLYPPPSSSDELPQNVFEHNSVLHNNATDQYAALRWLADVDDANLHPSYVEEIKQRYIAAVLYFSTGGVTSWLDGLQFLDGVRNECYWHEEVGETYWGPRGIYCDDKKRITTISIFSNNLVGTIPSELSHLQELRGLHLMDGSIGGTLPPELGGLFSAAEILLGMNDLTGTIPPEFGQLPRIEMLSIWANRLTGTIPPELGDAKTLEFLLLRNNTLTGSVPSSLKSLASLHSVFLQNNDLTGSLEFLCEGVEAKRNWTELGADCLDDVECSCCTQCY